MACQDVSLLRSILSVIATEWELAVLVSLYLPLGKRTYYRIIKVFPWGFPLTSTVSLREGGSPWGIPFQSASPFNAPNYSVLRLQQRQPIKSQNGCNSISQQRSLARGWRPADRMLQVRCKLLYKTAAIAVRNYNSRASEWAYALLYCKLQTPVDVIWIAWLTALTLINRRWPRQVSGERLFDYPIV